MFHREGERVPLREFRDGGGRLWTAWEVQPQGVDKAHRRPHEMTEVRASHRAGWLAFLCSELHEKRRLIPIPGNWVEMREEELRRLCAAADEVRERPRVAK